VVLCEVVDSSKRVIFAEVRKVITSSPDRIAASCAQYGTCGGCDLMHLTASAELEWKWKVVSDALRRIGGLNAQGLVEPCRALADSESGFRTRLTARPLGDFGIGLHQYRSHAQVECPTCEVTDIRLFEKVRWAQVTDSQVRGAIGTAGEIGLAVGHLDERVSQSIHTPVGEQTWDLPASVFWQVHRHAAQVFGDLLLDLAKPQPGESWWDLYGGVGLFSAFLADCGARVDLVEADERAVDCAIEHFPPSGPVTIHACDVGSWLKAAHASSAPGSFKVVLDPPRSGLGAEVALELAGLGPSTIVYVACDPAAFARDVKVFVGAGYQCERVIPVNAFPRTHHLETFALLTR
jgi:tRNA/tmRNA/rRNA uracil-C5-methylase (TrmA/RlmC/RlmD family)